MGEAIPLKRALKEKRHFVLDSGTFGIEGLEVPEQVKKLGKRRLFTTVATLVECVRDQSPESKTQEANIRRLATLLQANESTAMRAYTLYTMLRPLREDGPGVADIYIAAAAIERSYVVVTHDRKDFAEIPHVQYLAKWT